MIFLNIYILKSIGSITQHLTGATYVVAFWYHISVLLFIIRVFKIKRACKPTKTTNGDVTK